MEQPFLKMYDYHVWANKRVLEKLKEIPEEILQQEIQSVFPTILDAVGHTYRVDVSWLYVMMGKSFNEIMTLMGEVSEKIKTMTLADFENAYQSVANQYGEFFASLGYNDQPVMTDHPQFGKLETTVSELVQHVSNHGTYHRGNITAMSRQLGYPGASTDYIFYLYDKPKEEAR
ncbi:DinB family protein [Bacillus sp. FJAT-49736]|uniref:DinB family protein n=1 Tax=Bacillus sp. FJAT-49736 TaxID=2833582 RepID=UPI001BC91F80|nr:DinB family protein [Bacillus sp. FJAT-49736]MBS4174655.1 damage-inducible protein DinB [Bacillus sp. FJAT-49736]